MSGYVVGTDAAVSDLHVADILWQARDLVHDYLVNTEAASRENILAKLESLDWPIEEGASEGYKKLDLVTRIVQLMPPPLSEPAGEAEKAEKTLTHKLQDQEDQAATEYAVRLPPEYHPLRSYPAIVALHSGQGPQSAVEIWAAEAARRGYIVIAPEYRVAGQAVDYGYTPSEHAAVELALGTHAGGTRSTATGSSSRASSPAETWHGTSRWGIPTCSPARSSCRRFPRSTFPGTYPTTNACRSTL